MISERQEVSGIIFERNSNRDFFESVSSLVKVLNTANINDVRFLNLTGSIKFVVFEEADKIGNTVFVLPPGKSLDHSKEVPAQISKMLDSEGIVRITDFMSGEIGNNSSGWSVRKIFDRWGESYGEYFKDLCLFGCPVETNICL